MPEVIIYIICRRFKRERRERVKKSHDRNCELQITNCEFNDFSFASQTKNVNKIITPSAIGNIYFCR